MKRPRALLLGVLLATVPAARAEDPPVRALVPSMQDVHGEVSYRREGDETVVATLLYSRVLRRVIAEIAAREADAWPKGQAGSGDSEAYVEALGRARDAVAERSRTGGDRFGRTEEMLIELRANGDRGEAAFFFVSTRDDAGGPGRRIATRDEISRMQVSAAYARRNQALIVADAFGVAVEEARRMLASARVAPNAPAASP